MSNLSKQKYLVGLAKSLASLQRHEAEDDGFVTRIVSSGAPLRSGGDVGARDVAAIYFAYREEAWGRL